MRNKPFALAILALLVSSSACAAEPESTAPGSRTMVEVNGDPVTEGMFLAFRAARRQQGRNDNNDPQQQVVILNELVNTVLVSQDANARGLAERTDVAAALKVAHQRVLAQAAMGAELAANPITEEQINQAYTERYATTGEREFKARHILLESEEDARAVIAELDAGGDFAALAKERSTGPSGPQGGDLGWFGAGQMVEPFADAVAAMDEGSYSNAPVQTQFGWHVILLEDTRTTDAPTLEEVRTEITANLQRQVIAAYLTGLREKAAIDVKMGQQGESAASKE